MPWAKSFCPFRACGEKLAKLPYRVHLKKSFFDNFFKCNHLIIKWHFVGKRTKNYFLKWAQYIGWKNAIGFVGKRNRLRWQMKAASLTDEGFL